MSHFTLITTLQKFQCQERKTGNRTEISANDPRLVSPLGNRNYMHRKSMKEPLQMLTTKKRNLKENDDKMLQKLDDDDKENSRNYHNQVDCLSKYIESINLTE